MVVLLVKRAELLAADSLSRQLGHCLPPFRAGVGERRTNRLLEQMPRLHMSGSREVIFRSCGSAAANRGPVPFPASDSAGVQRGASGAPGFLRHAASSASRAARERVFSRPLLVQLGDEEDDLPLAVEPQAHCCARTLCEPAPDDVDAPVLVPAGIELAASERMGLVLP